MEILSRIKCKGKESGLILMVLTMKVNGSMMFLMDMGLCIVMITKSFTKVC